MVALKDAAYKTTMAASGLQVTVRALGCSESVCRLVGKTRVLLVDGQATFISLAVTKAGRCIFSKVRRRSSYYASYYMN